MLVDRFVQRLYFSVTLLPLLGSSNELKLTHIPILSQSTQIHSGIMACDGGEIAVPAQQSCLVLVIIAAVRSTSRCLLPYNYPNAVFTVVVVVGEYLS